MLYVPRNDRWIQTKELSKLFRTIFPEAEVKVALAEPPFEDPEGNALHFERQGKQHLTGKKLVNATRVDLLTSVATLLREIAKHMPNFVVGAGQGAIVCLAAASPVVVESVLLARNVHITEAHKVASAWAQVGEADVWGQPEDRKIETRRAASERGVSGMVHSARPRVLAQARHGRKIRASKGRD